ncbi:MAG: hypothetical protein ACRD0L_04380 [Acidimicrobiales bacterium]
MAMPVPNESEQRVTQSVEVVPEEPAAVPVAPATERAAVVGTKRSSRVRMRPVGLGFIGLLAVVDGAWGGIVPYVGPLFGYRSNGSGAWTWTLAHALLYLVPGAVAVAAGLFLLGLMPRAGIGRGRLGAGTAGLVLLACGAWFVVGPAVWPVFYAFPPVFGSTGSHLAAFVNQIGYNLGPGLILAALAGMAMKATRRERPVEVAAVREVAPVH